MVNLVRRFLLLTGVTMLLILSILSVFSQPWIAGQPASLSVRTAHAQTPSTKSFTVMITANGFNNGSLDIAVNQGDTVQITFTMDQSQQNNKDPSNHHIMSILGYNVTTGDINPSHPSATVSFLASKVGTFNIVCIVPECPIHYLMLSGIFEVKPAGQTSSSATTISGSSSSSASTSLTSSSTSTTSSALSTSSTSESSGQSTPSIVTTTQTVTTTTTSSGDSGDLNFSLTLMVAIGTLIVGLIAGMIVRPIRESAGR